MVMFCGTIEVKSGLSVDATCAEGRRAVPGVRAGDVLGKPHTVENAVAQLSRFSGRAVQFFTGLCLRRGEVVFSCVEPFVVRFRPLTEAEIRAYVALELPLQSAGSFKSEGLGILLFDALEGRDPNALVGLPLIALRELFEQHGTSLLAEIERVAHAK